MSIRCLIQLITLIMSLATVPLMAQVEEKPIVEQGGTPAVEKKKSKGKKKLKKKKPKLEEAVSDQPSDVSGGLGLTGNDDDMSPPKEDGEVTASSSARFQRFGLGASAGFAYLGFGGGVDMWYSPAKKVDLSFRLLGSSSKLAASGDDILYLETANVSLMQLALNARFFVGKSFFLLGGLGLNSYSGDYGVTVNPSKKEYLLPMKASAASINFAIGNMWKWDSGFTLGFDWLGYSMLGGVNLTLKDPDSVEEAQIFQNFRTIPGGGDPKEKAKAILTKNNIYLLMMTIGYGF